MVGFRLRLKLYLMLLAVFSLLSGGFLVSCGGGGGGSSSSSSSGLPNQGTPSGTGTVVITGSIQ